MTKQNNKEGWEERFDEELTVPAEDIVSGEETKNFAVIAKVDKVKAFIQKEKTASYQEGRENTLQEVEEWIEKEMTGEGSWEIEDLLSKLKEMKHEKDK